MQHPYVIYNARIPIISIHASLAGCNLNSGTVKSFVPLFQFMHPLLDATEGKVGSSLWIAISIHAPPFGIQPPAAETCEEYLPISIHAPLSGCNRKLPFCCSQFDRILLFITVYLHPIYLSEANNGGYLHQISWFDGECAADFLINHALRL